MKQVLLINPKTVNKYYHVSRSLLDRFLPCLVSRCFNGHFDIPAHSHCTTMPPITLFALDCLIKDHFQTVIVDEQVDEIPFDQNCDLVLITSTTPQIHRAVEISEVFHRRKIPTVIGGIHASCLPDECQKHFSSVCVGEAEGYLEELLEDFEHGHLKPRYTNHQSISMEDAPFFHDEAGGGKYLPFHVLSFSRGCPFKCDFCSIQSTLGGYRTRTVESVVKEIERVGSRHLWFPDATLTGNPSKAVDLFKALKPLKVQWLGQITLNTCRDKRLLDLMAESGCWLVSAGFESLDETNIAATSKTQNHVEDYREIIDDLHQRNIAIEGNFVFGFDHDEMGVFESTAEFTIETGIDLPEYYVLTPYPGTSLYARLKAEGRIVDNNWAHYDNTHFHYLPVFTPHKMTRNDLREGCLHTEQIVYSYQNTLRRIWKSGVYRGPVLLANFIYASRISNRRSLIPVGEKIGIDQGLDNPMDGPISDGLAQIPVH